MYTHDHVHPILTENKVIEQISKTDPECHETTCLNHSHPWEQNKDFNLFFKNLKVVTHSTIGTCTVYIGFNRIPFKEDID